jgi:pimeloyl-ACP methyl ester carboxylesterase
MEQDMSTHPLDDPAIISLLFYPRPAQPGSSRVPNTRDGTIPVLGDIVLGHRLYNPENPTCVVLFFHGNGEVASDYDDISQGYFACDAALLIVDYRGYGWSTGTPLTTALLTDAEAVLPVLSDILKPAGLFDLPVFIMGRSLGSAPAIHLAHAAPDRFAGLIIESGFADMPSVFRNLGIPVDLSKVTDLPVANTRRMQEIDLPLLVIHGENDTLLPVENGQQLFDASPVDNKTILRVPRAGHNDLLYYGFRIYFGALARFIQENT